MQKNYELLGIELDPKTYEEYSKKTYYSPVEECFLTIKALGIRLQSNDYKTNWPEAVRAAENILDRVKTELRRHTNAAKADDQAFADDTVQRIFEELDSITRACSDRFGVLHEHRKTLDADYNSATKAGLDARNRAIIDGRYQENLQQHEATLKDLNVEHRKKIAALRERLQKVVAAHYTASPDRLDQNTMQLLSSGILTADEFFGLAQRHRDNPTMLRIIRRYALDYGTSDMTAADADMQKARVLASHLQGITNGGKNELEVFDSLSEWSEMCLDPVVYRGRATNWDETFSQAMSYLEANAAFPTLEQITASYTETTKSLES